MLFIIVNIVHMMGNLFGYFIFCRFCLKANGNDGANLVRLKDCEVNSGVAISKKEWTSMRFFEEDDVCGEVLIGLLVHILIIILRQGKSK